jgi:poly-gamma-glutamate synthase PgsB/CapB
VFLIAETIILWKRTAKIKLRITVSGTRGKTGVTRDLASVLRKSGMSVLAKTTGSEPVYILPDGSEEPVPRRGIISIIEQKRVIAKAASLGVDCLLTEIMSISPENHLIESRRIIKPHLTLLTNFRADHLDVSDGTLSATEAVYLNDIAPGSEVFIHRDHISQHLGEGIANAGAKLIPAEPGTALFLNLNTESTRFRIAENLDLVCAAARHLKITDTDIKLGIEGASHDTGRPELFKFCRNDKTIWFANTFAANDPLSTVIISELIITESGISVSDIGGLLSLRSDRGERTKQWIDYLKKEPGKKFHPLFVIGSHKYLIKRRLPGSVILLQGTPESITNQIIDHCHDKTVIFGLANIVGTGNELVKYWREKNDNAK